MTEPALCALCDHDPAVAVVDEGRVVGWDESLATPSGHDHELMPR